MQKHINQANHNHDFHDCLQEKFNDKFFDWKITVLFYTAIHYLKALSAKRGKDIGFTHKEIENAVNPDKFSTTMPIKKGAWTDYKALYRYSKTARYEGFQNNEVVFEQLRKIDHSHSNKHLKNFIVYIKSQGI